MPLDPAGVELTPDEMVEQARKRAPLVPNVMAVLLACLDAITPDQLLRLMALSSSAIQVGIDMGLTYELFMQLMDSGWTVMRREDVEDACEEAKCEARGQ